MPCPFGVKTLAIDFGGVRKIEFNTILLSAQTLILQAESLCYFYQYLTKYYQNKTFVLLQLDIIIDNYKQIKRLFK